MGVKHSEGKGDGGRLREVEEGGAIQARRWGQGVRWSDAEGGVEGRGGETARAGMWLRGTA